MLLVILLGLGLTGAGVLGVASPSHAAENTITLSNCYTDVAGRTFEVAQGDTLRIDFANTCTWAYGASFIGFSRESPGTGENEVAVYDAWNVKLADVTRTGPGQASIIITPNPGLRETSTSTSGSYFVTPGADRYQQFRVTVTASPDPADGTNWEPLGEGMNNDVRALAVAADDTLYAAGYFSSAGDGSASRIAAWDGTQWRPLGSGIDNSVNALVTDGSGRLFAGGQFSTAGGVSTANIAQWDGSQWRAVGAGLGDTVNALAVDDVNRVYAATGSPFSFFGGSNVSSWNGTAWTTLGNDFDSAVMALAVDDEGYVYAGGSFSSSGATSLNGIARWNGTAWSALGTGLGNTVRAIATGPDGSIYAGGDFVTAGGSPANNVARWDGSAWTALGAGMNGSVLALSHDGVQTLYAAGSFTSADGLPVNRVAKWDGTSWSAVGTGMDSTVNALALDASGDLYAAGTFISAGGASAYRVAMHPGTAAAPTAVITPKAAPQAFAVPAGVTASQCAALAPSHVTWPGITKLPNEGWSISYAAWPNAGAGGWVCQRQAVYANGSWTFS